MKPNLAFVLLLSMLCGFNLQKALRAEDPQPIVRIVLDDGDYLCCEEDWDRVGVYVLPPLEAVRVDYFLDDRVLSSVPREQEPSLHRFPTGVSFPRVASGPHVIRAKAILASGEKAWSAPVRFFVDRPPVITVLSPVAGADIWRSVHVKADVADDFGIKSVQIGQATLAKPPYETDFALPETFTNPDNILFEPEPDGTLGQVPPGPCVWAWDSMDQPTGVCPEVHIKRLFYPDSSPPTFYWLGYFQNRHPEAWSYSQDKKMREFTPGSLSTDWSVAFSLDKAFQLTIFCSPTLSGLLPTETSWQPSPQEWLSILAPGKDRPNDDVPIYFSIKDGDGAVLWQDYFVISKAEPMTPKTFVTDKDGNKFPCGERLDHNKSCVTEISDNADFEGPLIFRQDNGNLPPRGNWPAGGPWPDHNCLPGYFLLPMDSSKACTFQERYEKLYIRYRAKDALGRETVTQAYTWPHFDGCTNRR